MAVGFRREAGRRNGQNPAMPPTLTTTTKPRIAILGLGAIGQRVLTSLQGFMPMDASYAALVRTPGNVSVDVQRFTDVEALLDWRPDLAVESAGHGVVADVVPRLLRAGTDVVIVSIGALGDARLRDELRLAGQTGGAKLITVAGAMGGLDALEAARGAGLTSVRYIGRKPPLAWAGTPADNVCDLGAITAATTVFEGSAAHAARLFPKNANVTAAVALAGVGFERTAVQLIADPAVSKNVHELEVEGAFGRFFIRLENKPLPDNAKTSWLAALSIEAALRRYFDIAPPTL